MPEKLFELWAILELMGHRRLAGKVTDANIGGGAFLRIDISAKEGMITQYYAPGSVYCITPTTEEMARLAAAEMEPAPISKWEVKELMQRQLPSETAKPHYQPEDDGFGSDDNGN